MNPVILIHGGAGPDSDFIKNNYEEYKEGLRAALDAGYKILTEGGTALDAVENAVQNMENNPLFNCGRGSALNAVGKVEMCAGIMDGKMMRTGATAIATNVRHPISLARKILEKDGAGYIGSYGAGLYSEHAGLEIMPDDWFVTDHQKEAQKKAAKEEKTGRHGTVGAVALDSAGNLAAATSTGGLENCKPGRIADSGMIGVGCYADNNTCAVSCTGDGEYIIRGVMAHAISCQMKYNGKNVKEACKEILAEETRDTHADLGVIALDTRGNLALHFNSERMHRGWKTADETGIFIYNEKEER